MFVTLLILFVFSYQFFFLSKEGENVAKLEKADILELTVRHLHTLRRQNILGIRSENTYAEKFKAGFRHCAAEVSNFLNVVDQETSVPIIKHLNSCMNHMERNTAVAAAPPPPPVPGNAMHMHHPIAPPPPAVPLASRPSIQIQSPNQINAHAVAAAVAHRQSPTVVWPTKGRSPVPIVPQPKHQMIFQHPPPPHAPAQPANANHLYVNHRSPNSTPDTHLMDSSTRVNTPPMSPKIDIENDSVWRPW